MKIVTRFTGLVFHLLVIIVFLITMPMTSFAGGLVISGSYAGYFSGDVHVTGNHTVDGSVTASSFSGDGANLTNIGPTSLSTGAVTSNALAAGAITSSKIAYYSDVAIVAPSGGDYTNPYDAMNDVTNWCNSPTGPTSSRPCLVKIMPGIYNIGTNSVAMQPWCDIEGSGQLITTIQGNVDSLTDGVVNGETHAEIRFLTVENTGVTGEVSNTNAVAISNDFSPSMGKRMKITKVNASAGGATSGASGWNIGIQNLGGANPFLESVRATGSQGNHSVGVLNEGSSPTLEHVYATGHFGSTNYGVLNNSSSPTLMNVTAHANGGLNYDVYTDTVPLLGGSVVTITGSSMTGPSSYSVYTVDSQGTGVSITYIASSLLIAPTGTASGGVNKCAFVYDSTLNTYAGPACP